MNLDFKRKISFFISLLVIFSVFLTGYKNPILANSEVKQNFNSEIISDRLKAELKNNIEYYDVMVFFKEEASFENAKLMSAKFDTKESSALKERKAIVGELKEVAYKSQAKISEWLAEEKQKGNVKEYKNFFIINAMHLVANKEVIEKISLSSEVYSIELNESIKMQKPIDVKKDEKKSSDFTLFSNKRPEYEWNIAAVGANLVWDKLKVKGENVVVGIIDSEVNVNHKALKSKFRGYDSSTDTFTYEGNYLDAIRHNKEPNEKRDQSHGSHVTGIVLGSEKDENNVEFNQIGVAPEAKFITARVFDDDGASTTDAFLTAAQWMLAPNGESEKAPQIINNSWGDGRTDKNQWFKKAVESWRKANIVPVFASGNRLPGEAPPGPGSISSPANYEESFAVGAIDKNNKLANFSKRGPSPFTDKIKPDVTAPGVAIRSSVGKGYVYMTGTSMAAPHVSGVAALVKSANPGLNVNEIENILRNTADPMTDETYHTSPNHGYGYGRVNAYSAVSEALGTGNGRIEGTVKAGSEFLEAEIYIKENGRTYRSDSTDGKYVLVHPAGEFTLVAKAYGYEAVEKPVNITKGGKLTVDFELEKQDMGDLEINLQNKDGVKITGAFARLLEDSNIEFNDEVNKLVGRNIPVGKYMLRLFKEPYKFVEQEVIIKKGLNSIDITLAEEGPQEEEMIKYDSDQMNRNADQNMRIGALGYEGAAVKFVPLKSEGIINSVSIRFAQRVGMYTGTKANLSIKERDERGRIVDLLPPIEIDFNPNEWNTYSLAKYQLKTDKPYYVVVQTTKDSSFILGVDQSADADYSFIYQENNFYSASNIFVYGGLMMRANMTYPQGSGDIVYNVKPPVLDKVYPEEKKVNGKAEPYQGVQIVLESGLRLNEVADDKGVFSFILRKSLKAGEEVLAYGKDKNGVKSTAVRTYVLTDKSNLISILKTAEKYKTYKPESEENKKLNEKIDEANKLLADIKKVEEGSLDKITIETNQNAIDVLVNEIKALILKLSPAKENLNIEIQKAKKNINEVWISQNGRDVPETKHWVRSREWSKFNRAITSAMAIYADVNVEVSKIERAIAKLKDETLIFDSVKQKGFEKVLIVDNRYSDGRWEGEGRGNSMLANHIIVTIQDGKIVNLEIKEWNDNKAAKAAIEKDRFLDRIVEENALDVRLVKGYEVESKSIIKAITQAIEKALKEGHNPNTDKQPLINAINKAKKVKASLPLSDGKGVSKDYKWTDKQAHADLDAAINEAEKNLNDKGLTIDMRDKTITLLEIAMRNFLNTKRVGPVVEEAPKKYHDGIYKVEAYGNNKIIPNVFLIEIKDNKVVSINIEHWADTPGYDKKIAPILKGEKSDNDVIDTISHATNSSKSVRDAVKKAFELAEKGEVYEDDDYTIEKLRQSIFDAKKLLYMTDLEGSFIKRGREYKISRINAQKFIREIKKAEEKTNNSNLKIIEIKEIILDLKKAKDIFIYERKN